jgi:hypothetical protein
MKRILLYSPDLVGHPSVYCRVIADALAQESCEVVIAMGFTDKIGLNQLPDIQPLSSRAALTLIDTRNFSRTGKSHLSAEELVELQVQFGTDTTLFIEADKSNTEFLRIAAGEAPRLCGRNLGIFANTAEWYPGEDSFTGERRRLVAPTVRTTLGNCKRAILNRRQSARYFYEKIIIRSGVLDEILVKDERLAKWRGPPVHWLPEISRPPSALETPEECTEYLRRRSEIERFLSTNKHREPVLYFGDATYYKGYDLFLEFVAVTPSTCAIHAGRSFDPQHRSLFDAQHRFNFRYDVQGLRAKLADENRLYETNAYVHTQRLKELFFGSIRLYITTHRLALSSSTVIQALELGKPVLVPDRGLLGYRVRNNNLGDVYKYEDLSDLAQKAEKLWRTDLGGFTAAAETFWQRFSDKAIRSFFAERLLSSPV